jgi:hypothetical protein
VLRQVKVQIVEIPWLNNNSPELLSFLADLHDHQVYRSELIRAILLKQDYTMQIVLKFLLPFIVYMICNIVFQTYYITSLNGAREDGLFGGSGSSILMKILIIVLSVYFIGIEIMQMMSSGWSYLHDKWNLLNFASYSFNLAILLVYISGTDYDTLNLAYASSFACFIMWGQVFYWMRLFEKTSFYVKMIIETMYDIRYFLIMLLVCVATFANAILILDLAQNRAAESQIEEGSEEYARVINESTGNNIVDALLN